MRGRPPPALGPGSPPFPGSRKCCRYREKIFFPGQKPGSSSFPLFSPKKFSTSPPTWSLGFGPGSVFPLSWAPARFCFIVGLAKNFFVPQGRHTFWGKKDCINPPPCATRPEHIPPAPWGLGWGASVSISGVAGFLAGVQKIQVERGFPPISGPGGDFPFPHFAQVVMGL